LEPLAGTRYVFFYAEREIMPSRTALPWRAWALQALDSA
jgi:hypothetical protein